MKTYTVTLTPSTDRVLTVSGIVPVSRSDVLQQHLCGVFGEAHRSYLMWPERLHEALEQIRWARRACGRRRRLPPRRRQPLP